MNAPNPSTAGLEDDCAPSVPAAWLDKGTWRVRHHTTNCYGDADVAEYALSDDDVAEILCGYYCRSMGADS